jgi:hypothetical protein
MMKRFLVFVLVVGAAIQSRAYDANRPLDAKSLEGKSVEQLYLMRNEIFARHGKPFKTYELDQYFHAQPWYKLDLEFSDARLTATEKANASLLLQREKELLKRNILEEAGGPRLSVGNVYNRRQFGAFSEGDLEKLSKNGILIAPARHEQFFHLYEDNAYKGVASFVTADAVLQLYHVFFDFALRNLEQEKLLPLLERLTREMAARSRALAAKSSDARVRQAANRNLAFFSVGEALLTGKAAQADGAVADVVQAELRKIKAHEGRGECLLFPQPAGGEKHCVDYSQFVPRGHYTRSEALKRYFTAMMWYGQCAFVASVPEELDAALVTTWLLNQPAEPGGESPAALWTRVYEATAFFAGLSDDVGPDDLWPEIQKLPGASASVEGLLAPEAQARLRGAAEAIAKRKTRILVEMICLPKGPQVRFMGQRYIPDSEVLQRLSTYPERCFPKGLDVAAALGSEKARAILLEEIREGKAWKEYPSRLDAVTRDLAGVSPEAWRQNLYWGWLWCLKALYEPPAGKGVPFFVTTDGWRRKGVNASLGSWAELRHDTILYGKQSGAECGDGDEWVPDPPKGYVEPNPVFFGRLGDLLAVTRTGLQRRELMTPRLKEKLERFEELASFLKRVAEKELAGQPLTAEENGRIQIFGADLELLTLSVITDDDLYSWYEIQSETDKHVAVVADVHTCESQVLEEAVGPAYEIYVVVEMDGYLKLLRGAVFSYYEFQWPASDRLTDEAWQKMLREGKAPPLPGWVKPILSDDPKREVPRPDYTAGSAYSSGC